MQGKKMTPRLWMWCFRQQKKEVKKKNVRENTFSLEMFWDRFQVGVSEIEAPSLTSHMTFFTYVMSPSLTELISSYVKVRLPVPKNCSQNYD